MVVCTVVLTCHQQPGAVANLLRETTKRGQPGSSFYTQGLTTAIVLMVLVDSRVARDSGMSYKKVFTKANESVDVQSDQRLFDDKQCRCLQIVPIWERCEFAVPVEFVSGPA